MSRVTEQRCDKCGDRIGHGGERYGIGLTVNYHHPRNLDLCTKCEDEFTIFLGKHPLWGTPMEAILEGGASGQGYPSIERLQILRRERHMKPWCPICVREGRFGKGHRGVLEKSSPGGTDTYSCGHTIGK